MKVIEKIKAAEQAITDALRSLIDLDPEPDDFERLHDDMKRARVLVARARESLSGIPHFEEFEKFPWIEVDLPRGCHVELPDNHPFEDAGQSGRWFRDDAGNKYAIFNSKSFREPDRYWTGCTAKGDLFAFEKWLKFQVSEGNESISGPSGYDQQQYLEIARRCMTDEQPIAVTTQIKEAWIIVAALQLARRHPGLTPMMAGAVEQVGRQYQAAITQAHPDAATLLEMGWDSRFDK